MGVTVSNREETEQREIDMVQANVVVLLLLVTELGDRLYQLPVLLVVGVGQSSNLVVIVLCNGGLQGQ